MGEMEMVAREILFALGVGKVTVPLVLGFLFPLALSIWDIRRPLTVHPHTGYDSRFSFCLMLNNKMNYFDQPVHFLKVYINFILPLAVSIMISPIFTFWNRWSGFAWWELPLYLVTGFLLIINSFLIRGIDKYSYNFNLFILVWATLCTFGLGAFITIPIYQYFYNRRGLFNNTKNQLKAAYLERHPIDEYTPSSGSTVDFDATAESPNKSQNHPL